jgi:hypothetical protein
MPAFAYSVSEHASITADTIDQFQLCFPHKLSQLTRENLIFSNMEEDLNLLQKWVRYSHFYNPYKDLSTWRGTSLDRVRDSSAFLANWRLQAASGASVLSVEEAVREVGHVIHHIQDSAVPPHVVPVKHWLRDGFERYHADSTERAFTCADLMGPVNPSEELRTSALETLASLKGTFQVLYDGQPRTIDWSYYWRDTGELWGSYGLFGNGFGSPHLMVDGGDYEISPEAYKSFWLARRWQAMRHTARILQWFFSNLPSSFEQLLFQR